MASQRRAFGREYKYAHQEDFGAMKNGEVYANSGENPGPQTAPPDPPGTIKVQPTVPKKTGQQAHIVRTDGKKTTQKGILIDKAFLNPHSIELHAAASKNLLVGKKMSKILAAQRRGSLGKGRYNLQIGGVKIETSQTPIERKKAGRKNKRQRIKIRRFG